MAPSGTHFPVLDWESKTLYCRSIYAEWLALLFERAGGIKRAKSQPRLLKLVVTRPVVSCTGWLDEEQYELNFFSCLREVWLPRRL